MTFRKLSQAFAMLLLTSLFLFTPHSVYATAIAESAIAFNNLQIIPASGTLQFLFDWELEALAEARNSLGEEESDFDFSTGGSVHAAASVTYAGGEGFASAPAPPDPPSLDVDGGAASAVEIPSEEESRQANSLGRGTLFNEFMITGGTGTVNVDFFVDIAGFLRVGKDENDPLAETEIIFGMELDGDPILFRHFILTASSEITLDVSETLSTTVPLEFDIPYFLLIEVDSESEVITAAVPELSTFALMLIGFGILAGHVGRRRFRKGKKKMSQKTGTFSILLLLALSLSLLLSQSPAQAKYLPGEKKPVGCDCADPDVPGGSAISLTEGKLRDDIDVATIRSANGATIDFWLTYNSYNADHSRSQIDTVMGYGWAHSYNVFLFSQRGHMFRMDGESRITKYIFANTSPRRPLKSMVEERSGSTTMINTATLPRS